MANAYVFRIFRDEYKVFDHIKNLQRVYLLGAGDLMLTFYSNLFQNVSKILSLLLRFRTNEKKNIFYHF